ncbi:HET-domain-containing protein [Hypomontagnella monticulosa]|nr:HET-domain-containing protein [Hypomontagnella monticulosa]
MRLLNCRTMQMEEFFDSHIPKYAILSHTWGEKEVSYQAFVSRSLTEGPGYEKIEGFCSLAAGLGYEWAWVDTCCIDKSSSAELSEAINSMFHWYRSSDLCIIYLSDVYNHLNLELRNQAFRLSRWHTRGWTLQELLAPRRAVFYDKTWNEIGSKQDLEEVITDITKISGEVLVGRNDPRSLPVAERISWASNRRTSREEDIAYCLLGLLGVNMPLLYGEGRKAFTRLQEEVIRNTYDHTILARDVGLGLPTSSLTRAPCLATSPDAFREWDAEIMLTKPRGDHYLPTNLGIHISLPIIRPMAMNLECGLAILDCVAYGAKTLVLPLELDKRHNSTMLAWTARSAVPFLAHWGVTSMTFTTIPLYLTPRASGESLLLNERLCFIMDLRCLFDIGYFLADFFPSSNFKIDGNHIFYRRLIGGHKLLRFCHPSYVTILVMHEGCEDDPMRCGLQTAYITYPYTSWELTLTRESIDDVQQAYDSLSWSTTGYMNRVGGGCYVGGLDFDDHEIAVIKSLPARDPDTYIRPIQPRSVPLQE